MFREELIQFLITNEFWLLIIFMYCKNNELFHSFFINFLLIFYYRFIII
jgi:hypothetical protein